MSDQRYPGTTFEKKRGRWKAQFRKNGIVKSLGYFDTQLEAYQAVLEAKGETDAPSHELLLARFPDTTNSIQKNRATGTVAQSNILISRPWSMSILEARVFILLLRGLQGHARERIVVPISEILQDNHAGGNRYQQLQAALVNLDAIRIDLPMPDKKNDLHRVPLIHSVQLDSGQGTISGQFSSDVMPYLTNLVDNFTLGQVADLLSIRSTNTYKLYWLMLMWKFRSPHTVDIETLRELTTGKTAYPQYADYRIHVLKPSLEELNAMNFDITYREHKVGRSVGSIEFNIHYNGNKLKPKQLELPLAVVAAAETPPSEIHNRVGTRLRKLQLTEAQINKVLQVLAGDEQQLTKLMKVTHALLLEVETKSKHYDNLGASAMNILKTTFPQLYLKHS